MNIRVFVSGGAGVIGKPLVNQLLEKGAIVFVGDLKPCPPNWRSKIYYRQGDLITLTKEEILLFDPHIYIHLAATFEGSIETPEFFEENFHHNVSLSHHLLSCIKHAPSLQRIVFASSYLVYNPNLYLTKTIPNKPYELKESSPLSPRNLYGAAKFFHEKELELCGISAISARIFRVYGRGSKDVISRWIRSLLKNEKITVYQKENLFDYIFADDVAEGLIHLALSSEPGVVNLGRGEARSIQEVLSILKDHFSNATIFFKKEFAEYEASFASLNQLEKITSWKPSKKLEEGILEIISYEKNKKDFKEVEKSSVLITSISKKIPLIEEVKFASKKFGQIEKIYGADANQECIGKYFVDVFWQMPDLNTLSKEDILLYCRSNNIHFILPTRDQELPFFAKTRDFFLENNIFVMISSEKTISLCQDKYLFSKILKEHKLPSIPTYEDIEEVTAPLIVVKERLGAGSLNIGLSLKKDEAKKQREKLIDPIFQPYIEGIEWSVDVYRSFQGDVLGVVTRKRDLIENGESKITTTFSHPKLEALGKNLAECLQIQGHAIFQIIEDVKGEFHVIECNPRFGGASSASLFAGLDTFFWFFLEMSQKSIAIAPCFRQKYPVRQIRYPKDKKILWS